MGEVVVERVRPPDVVEIRHRNLRQHTTVEEAVFDGDDHPTAGHFLVTNDGEPVAVATVVKECRPGRTDEWRVRGMATDPAHRNRGHGALALAACLEWAEAHDAKTIWCNARTPAVSLYERAGFRVVSGIFEPPHLGPHVEMERNLEEARL